MTGIACPGCSDTRGSDVTDSRPDAGRIRRRRQCKNCDRRYTTYESMDVGEYDRVTLDGLNKADRMVLRHLAKRLRGLI